MTEIHKHLPFVDCAVHAVDQAWCAAHMESILLRPLNYLDVPGGVINCLALLYSEYPSLMCRRTSECTRGGSPSGLLVGKPSHPDG